jgi:hypothetical protein
LGGFPNVFAYLTIKKADDRWVQEAFLKPGRPRSLCRNREDVLDLLHVVNDLKILSEFNSLNLSQ